MTRWTAWVAYAAAVLNFVAIPLGFSLAPGAILVWAIIASFAFPIWVATASIYLNAGSEVVSPTQASYVTPADVHDAVGARKLLGDLAFFVPRLKRIWADGAYRGKELADWHQQQGAGWELETVEREPGAKGFQVQLRW